VDEQIDERFLREWIARLELVEIPDADMPRVLAAVRTHRAAMQRLEQSHLPLRDTFTAHPYRA
jgi:hypothetical protein